MLPSLKNYQFFWRDPYQHKVDFIEIENNRIIPVEIKYKEKIYSRDIKNLLIFSKKFNCKKAIVIKKGIEEKSTFFDSHQVEIIEKPVYKIFVENYR